MNKISKFACSFVLALSAITAVYTNVSFGMNPQKDFPEYILQNKLKELNKEKENQEASWFNKLYLHKIYGNEPSFIKDQLITFFFSSFVFYKLLDPLLPRPQISDSQTPEIKDVLLKGIRALIMVGGNLGSQLTLGKYVQEHKIRVKVNNEKIKNLEEILEEMKK